jgi:hypothetical protein
MKKGPLLFPFVLLAFSLHAQSVPSSRQEKIQLARFVGKYEMNGNVIQFALQNNYLVLIVPGAPIQPMKPLEKNQFTSETFPNQLFRFAENSGTIHEVIIIEGQQETFRGKKTSERAEVFSLSMDSLLTMQKSTAHFHFLYSETDSVSVKRIATDMEKNYDKILNDFKIKEMPEVTVRIYPDLQSFHLGINFPNAPDQVLATAFGKDDIRMVSPLNAGPESWMLAYVASHEFTHCVHLNFDYAPNNPKWLWEGVAQFEAGWFFDPSELEFITKKDYPHLADLNNGVDYMLGFVIIEAIKDLWGFDVVLDLIKSRGDVQKVLGVEMKEFEGRVFGQVYEKYIQKK